MAAAVYVDIVKAVCRPVYLDAAALACLYRQPVLFIERRSGYAPIEGPAVLCDQVLPGAGPHQLD